MVFPKATLVLMRILEPEFIIPAKERVVGSLPVPISLDLRALKDNFIVFRFCWVGFAEIQYY